MRSSSSTSSLSLRRYPWPKACFGKRRFSHSPAVPRADETGPEIERLERAETEALLGGAFQSIEDTEDILETFVVAQGAAHEKALARYFRRRIMRRLQLIRDYPAPIVARGLGKTR